MKTEDRYERGIDLISDALFVRDTLINAAVDAKKWNIVVFEAYRCSELPIKGIIYSIGYEPSKHHKLHILVGNLANLLEKEKYRFPFIYQALDQNGNGYQIRISKGMLRLLKK